MLVKLANLKILKYEGLLAFHEVLGFDNENDKSLDVRKVVMNLEDQKEAVQSLREGFIKEDEIGALMLFLDKGPAGDESVPKGYIRLEDGWKIKRSC